MTHEASEQFSQGRGGCQYIIFQLRQAMMGHHGDTY